MPWPKLSASGGPTSLAEAPGLDLSSAVLHSAPATRGVTGAVEEQPAAASEIRRAATESAEIGRLQEFHRRHGESIGQQLGRDHSRDQPRGMTCSRVEDQGGAPGGRGPSAPQALQSHSVRTRRLRRELPSPGQASVAARQRADVATSQGLSPGSAFVPHEGAAQRLGRAAVPARHREHDQNCDGQQVRQHREQLGRDMHALALQCEVGAEGESE